MASLQELLVEEGFEHRRFTKSQRKVKWRDRNLPDESSIALPIYICHDRKRSNVRNQKSEKALSCNGSLVSSSKRADSDSRRSNTRSIVEGKPRGDEPAIDEVATRAVISILSGYVGQYLRDKSFRDSIRGKCYSCFMNKDEDLDNEIFANLELGIISIERLLECQETKTELRMKSLQNSVRLLSIVASLNSKSSRNGSTGGIPNSHLAACAQLYLSIVYKLDKNDRISARHLLQVFCDSPFLSRTHLLPELWEHFFLPHLLHLKIWYTQELEFVANSDYFGKEKKMKALNKLYNDQMDVGTTKFALYYKEWLKVRAEAPAIPSLPLPSRPSYVHSRRKSSDSFSSHLSSNNKTLYRTIFGSSLEKGSMDLDERINSSSTPWDLKEEYKLCVYNGIQQRSYDEEKKSMAHRRSGSQNYGKLKVQLPPESQKSDYFRFFSCRTEPGEPLRYDGHKSINMSIKRGENMRSFGSNDLCKAINTICCSDSLNDCETAIRFVIKTWLDSDRDLKIEATLSKPPVIEGILEILLASNSDEILELATSILAELVTKTEVNGQIILNSDPQLDIFMKLLTSSSLFLKAAVLLYLVKPKAKQMISIEWIPLILRVLEFGDQLQTLFSVRCMPQVTAYYFLDNLLTGFDEDKNMENARQVISLGGLSLLARRMEIGDLAEKNKAASVIYYCIQAEGSCRHYLSKHLNKESILALFVPGEQSSRNRHAVVLLTELLCLHKGTNRVEVLNEWRSLNSFHILLNYLQKALPEECPLIGAILLQLNLFVDSPECMIHRKEMIKEIIKAMDSKLCDERVQKQSARALLILGNSFSYTGEPTVEQCILREAGFDENSEDSFANKDYAFSEYVRLNEEDDVTENWQRQAAMVLLNRGKKRLLAALSDSISNGIPPLARASLVTVSWMSKYLHLVGDRKLQFAACSIFIPQLIESLDYGNALEERVLGSFALLGLIKHSDSKSKLTPLNKELVARLQDLSQVTWTAKELISIISSNSRHFLS